MKMSPEAREALAREIYDAADGMGWLTPRQTLRIAGHDHPECHGPRTMRDIAIRLGCEVELENLIQSGT